jgi:glycosyltransferase involved in cell wall biosynthesis
MSAPKLLFLVSEDWYFVSHRLPLAIAARDAGFDVAVATQVNAHGETIRDAGLELLPITLTRSNLSPTAAARELSALKKLYARRKPDIVHHVALKPVVLGTWAARSTNVKGIVNAIAGLGYTFASASLKAQLVRIPMRHALRSALSAPRTRTIVQNTDDLNELRESRMARAENLRLVPGSGVDLAKFDVGAPPLGQPLVVLPARLLRYKGIVEFVDAARILKNKGIAARFALVGTPDPQNPASIAEDQLQRWRNEGVIETWGWRNDIERVLSEATLVCLPSYYREGMPKSLLEAAAARRAIVTTDVPGCREIVSFGKAGWMVPPRDATALADALRDALSNAEKQRIFAEAAYKQTAEHFSLHAIIAQTLAIYDELLKQPAI